ncbi:MAG: hypothetical protein Kow00109_12210 [Acidobacteriota bacterium]
MNLNIHTRNVDLLPTHQKLIQRQTAKIRKLMDSFSPDAVELTIRVEKLPRGNQFQTTAILALPQETITVEKIQNAVTTSLGEALRELFRRTKRFKSQLKREQLWRRRRGVEEAATPSWEVEQLAAEYLERLETFVRREIYHLIIQGEIPPGVIEPQAIVDDVYLYVTAQPDAKPPELTVFAWMIQVSRELLQKRIAELQEHRDEPHVEETAGTEAPAGWDDETLAFFQPDEELRVEDLLEDPTSENPEELLEREETFARLQKAVAKLPPDLREAFVLFAFEGFTSDEIAMLTGKLPEEVRSAVEQAREQLRRELRA